VLLELLLALELLRGLEREQASAAVLLVVVMEVSARQALQHQQRLRWGGLLRRRALGREQAQAAALLVGVMEVSAQQVLQHHQLLRMLALLFLKLFLKRQLFQALQGHHKYLVRQSPLLKG
jgi:hypothetical protein